MPRDARLLIMALAVNGAAVAATVLLLAALGPRFPVPGLADTAERLALAARLSVWPALVVLLVSMAAMGARGLARAFNPIDDPEGRLYRVCQRALTNTVEQTLVFVPALWALSATVPAESAGWPAAFTAAFVLGRALFVAGYLVHPYARAPGMAMTWTVNVAAVGWALTASV